MPLNLINIRPGFNKQITDTAAEGQYVDGDFVRFRYGLPQQIEQLTFQQELKNYLILLMALIMQIIP
jgi:hypothetical protein